MKAGTFVLTRSMDIPTIVNAIVDGKAGEVIITIPEGFTAEQVAKTVTARLNVPAESAEAAIRDTSWRRRLDIPTATLEGYLFPSTYHFVPATSERDIILTMAEQFRKMTQPLFAQRDGGFKLTSHETLTLASIIEKETGVEAERPLVSAVFHNRLKRQHGPINHKLSRQMVNHAHEQGVGTIKVESLAGIRKGTTRTSRGAKARKNNRMKNSWSFYQLSMFIAYKAERLGIKVEQVDPAYTSQQCPACSARNQAQDRT